MSGRGIIRGVKRPDVHGDTRGLVLDGGSSMASVTQDATSGIYVPATTTEWATALSVAGVTTGSPSLLWLLQEASGNAADSIGTMTGTAAGTGATYRSSVSGWTRKGVAFADAATGVFTTTDAGLPDLSTTSMLVLGYATTSAPTGNEVLYRAGTTTNSRVLIRTSTVRLQGTSGANSATGTVDPTGQVRPFVLRSDRTNGNAMICSDQEKLAPAIGAVTGKQLSINDGSFSVPATHLYLAAFFGAAAEMTDAKVKALLQTLGWTIAWT